MTNYNVQKITLIFIFSYLMKKKADDSFIISLTNSNALPFECFVWLHCYKDKKFHIKNKEII